MRAFRIPIALLSFALMTVGALAADEPAAPKSDLSERIRRAAVDGPKDVPLAGQAKLHLPADKVFLPQPEAGEMMRAMGNPGDYQDLQGLILPKAQGAQWFVVVNFEKAGFVKDDDAKEWKADELLSSYREGTEEANKERSKAGDTPIEIVGWAEMPKYDPASHRLVWAMSLRDKGAAVDAPQSVNYNTYALGRDGYFTLNLVTDLKELPVQKERPRPCWPHWTLMPASVTPTSIRRPTTWPSTAWRPW